MANNLAGKFIAILVTDGFEQVELTEPKNALEHAGANAHIVSPNTSSVQGWNHDEKADTFDVDRTLEDANPDYYDALVLPGGVRNPDVLRTIPEAVRTVGAECSTAFVVWGVFWPSAHAMLQGCKEAAANDSPAPST